MNTAPATAAQITYARRLISERAEQMRTLIDQEAYLLKLWSDIHRVRILEGRTDCPAYVEAHKARRAEWQQATGGRLLPRSERPVMTTADPDVILAAAAASLAAADMDQYKSDLDTDPATLTAAQASALIDRIKGR